MFISAESLRLFLKLRAWFVSFTQNSECIGDKEKYIVDADSAKLGAPREVTLHLDRNHSDISKFWGSGDDGYELVKGKLQTMARIIQGMDVKCTKCDHSSEARKSLTLGR